MQMKMVVLGVVSMLMACVPTSVGSSTLAPVVLGDNGEVTVAEGQTSFVQDSINPGLTGLSSDATDNAIAPFAYEELSVGNSK